jgi:hypothetical protein
VVGVSVSKRELGEQAEGAQLCEVSCLIYIVSCPPGGFLMFLAAI